MDIKLGLVAYQNNRGLGIQTWEYYKNLKPVKTMVINNQITHGFEQFPERFPDAWRVIPGLPGHDDCEEFVAGLDIILMAENAPTYHLLETARKRGVKSVVVPNYEFHGYTRHPQFPKPDLFMCPSLWHFDDVVEPKSFMPVPIVPRVTPKPKVAKNFLHIIGKPAIHDRNGTGDLLKALEFVKADIKLTIKCQDPGYVRSLQTMLGPMSPHVELIVDERDTPNYWDNYKKFDAMILPRRFGGLCLPLNEAIGSGMPVIMPDISPNDTWLPKEWLLPAEKYTSFLAHNEITVYETDPKVLAKRIDKLATDEAFYKKCVEQAKTLAKENSWDNLRSLYFETFMLMINS